MTYSFLPVKGSIIVDNCFGQSRLQFEGIKDDTTKTKKGVRFHNGLTALFLKIMHKIVDIKDADGKIYHLNRGSLVGLLHENREADNTTREGIACQKDGTLRQMLSEIGQKKSLKYIRKTAKLNNNLRDLNRQKNERDARPLNNGKRNWSDYETKELEPAIEKVTKELKNLKELSFTSTYHWKSMSIQIPRYYEARDTTLMQLRNMNEEDRNEAVIKFKLSKDLEVFGGEEIFFQRLKNAPESILDTLTVQDLKLNISTYQISYLLMPFEQFNKLTLREVEYCDKIVSNMIMSRLCHTPKMKVQADDQTDFMNMSVIEFYHLSESDVSKFAGKFPKVSYHFISNKNLNAIDSTKLSEQQRIDLIYNFLYPTNENYANKIDRFANLSSDFVNANLDHLRYDYHFSLFSDKHIENLDLPSEYSQEKISTFLKQFLTREVAKKRIELLSVKFVNKYFKYLFTSQIYLWRYLTEKQLQGFEIPAECVKNKNEGLIFRNMFPLGVNDELHSRRFAQLPLQIVKDNIHKIDKSQLTLLSVDQFKNLDFTKLNQEVMDALLPAGNENTIAKATALLKKTEQTKS